VELTDEMVELNQQFEHLLFGDMLLHRIAYGILTLACLFFLVTTVYKQIRRRWNCLFLILLFVSVITWSALSLLMLFSADLGDVELFNSLRYIGIVLLPALLVLHIRVQVSYKGIHPVFIILYLIVPLFLVFIILRDTFFPGFLSILPASVETLWYLNIFYAYSALSLIRAYLLCFNVFYQMPRRTRRSTKSTLISTITLTLFIGITALFTSQINELMQQSILADLLVPLATPIALGFIIYPLFDSMYIMPASDVIVTSREFIMRGLSTTVLVLNRRHQILDWNRRDWDNEMPLLKPKYKEAYPVYRKRFIERYAGKVSPHNSDVIIVTKDGKESHFLQRIHKMEFKQRMFGYVVEIYDVTNIYSKLRVFEELAHIDTLTGLYNRNAYIIYTQSILKSENMPLLILVGDMNELKRINDVYGHLAGDELIKAIAKVIEAAKPALSFVARVGGDEFVVIAPNGSVDIAEKFIHRANTLCGEIQNEKTKKPSVSWGYAIMTSMDQSYNELFAEADKMMYEYKKNRIDFSSRGTLPSNHTDSV